MHLMLLVLVRLATLGESFALERSIEPIDVAVSLNSNEAAIYSYQGNDWVPESTLAEVRENSLLNSQRHDLNDLGLARQSDHVHRLGKTYEPHCYLLARSQCVCLD